MVKISPQIRSNLSRYLYTHSICVGPGGGALLQLTDRGRHTQEQRRPVVYERRVEEHSERVVDRVQEDRLPQAAPPLEAQGIVPAWVAHEGGREKQKEPESERKRGREAEGGREGER